MPVPHRLDAYHYYEEEWDDFESLRAAFEWEVPDEFNVATYCCDRWAADDQDHVAVYAESADGTRREVTFTDLQSAANQLANALADRGIEAGDRVGVSLPQSPEVLTAYLAVWKLGAIAVPLSTLFGEQALRYRMRDCDVAGIICGSATVETLRGIKADLPALETVLLVDADPAEDAMDEERYEAVRSAADDSFETVSTAADDDACIIYTSGTTGEPKGVLHAHRFVLGMLPIMSRNFMTRGKPEDEVWWSPVEWSWIGSLVSALSGLFYGVPLIAYHGGPFDPEHAFEIIERYDVTFFGGPPTMLRMMQNVENAGERYDVGTLSVIGAGGEALDQDTIDWIDETFQGCLVQEAYGQTETNINVGFFADLVPVREGKIGVAMPGHEVAVVDQETGEHTVELGDVGEIAVKAGDNPGVFKEYWNAPEKTDRKFHDGWVLTEDLGTIDAEGFLSFETRADDVILTSGYKVAPEAIEETLASHEAVAGAGVIGVPHDERGEVPRAYVTLVDEADPGEPLRSALQDYVKNTLAKYEYPRELRFVDELPTTNTGKVSRHRLRERAGIADP